jgi:hypothetical protein
MGRGGKSTPYLGVTWYLYLQQQREVWTVWEPGGPTYPCPRSRWAPDASKQSQTRSQREPWSSEASRGYGPKYRTYLGTRLE